MLSGKVDRVPHDQMKLMRLEHYRRRFHHPPSPLPVPNLMVYWIKRRDCLRLDPLRLLHYYIVEARAILELGVSATRRVVCMMYLLSLRAHSYYSSEGL